MLPDPLRLLVSAYAAGDLSPRRQKAAERLLRHSREARHLLRELRADRRRLRSLPRRDLPPDFAARVLENLPGRGQIIRPSVLQQPHGRSSGLTGPIAVAAGLLMAVAISTYLSPTMPGEQERPAARLSVSKADVEPVTAAPVGGPHDGESPALDVGVAKDVTGPFRTDGPMPPPRPGPDPLGNVPLTPPELVRVSPPRLPLGLPVRGLTREARQRLHTELAGSDAHHVDLFCRDTARGFDRLQASLKSRGVRVFTDAVVQESMKRIIRGQYLVFCDDLTAGEWEQVFHRVASADKRAEDRKAGEGVFEHLVVLPFTASDQKELVSFLGSDVSRGNGPRRDGAGGAEGRVLSAPNGAAKQAFAAAAGPWRTPASSKEGRLYLDSHSDRRAGTIAVIVVLRQPAY